MDEGACRVLVVAGEPGVADLVASTLRYEGFEVDTSITGRVALDKVAHWRPQLMVLDVHLADVDGFEKARQVRHEVVGVPILFLIARGGTEDKIRGLTVGGDDYLRKPFSLGDLLARVRRALSGVSDLGRTSTRLVFSDLELDEETREVARGMTPIDLTMGEFKLLRYLMLNPSRVLSKRQILDNVWEYNARVDAKVVATDDGIYSRISYLRKKIDGLGTPLIHTHRGAGYSLGVPTRRDP